MSFRREGLLFREVETTDLIKLRNLRNDPDSWQGWRNPLPIMSLTAQMEWYKTLGPDKMAFIVEDLEKPGVPVGAARITGIEEFTRSCGIVGLDVFPEARGHGYGAKMIRGLTDWLIRDLGAHRVTCESMDSNEASKKMILKSGPYVHEGAKRGYIWRDGKWIDFHQYSVLAEEWK